MAVVVLVAAAIYKFVLMPQNAGVMDGFKMPVAIYEAKPEIVAENVEAQGSIFPVNYAIITSEIAGVIKDYKFTEGDAVRKGDILFELQDSVQLAEKNAAMASYDLSKKNFTRTKELFAKKVISGKEYDDAEAKMKADEANYNLAVAKYEKTKIAAPFDGIIGISYVTNGQYVQVGTSLTSLQDNKKLEVSFYLSEKYLSKISKGEDVIMLVDSYPKEKFTGKITAIDQYVDAKTRNFSAKASFDNSENKLRAGSYAKLKLALNKSEKIMVPENGLLKIEQGDFVYLMVDDKAKITKVTPASRVGLNVEIVEGIKAGDKVIVSGLIKLRDGADVMDFNLLPKQPQ